MNGAAEPADPRRVPDVPGTLASPRRVHLFVLLVCLGMLGAAFVLASTGPDEQAGHLTLASLRLPEVCAFKGTTGVPCPGCGLTRSWVAAVHGDLAGSLAAHPLGWLILLYVTGQALRHGAWLAVPGRRAAVDAAGRWLDRGLIVLAVLLVVAWIPTVAGALVSAVAGSSG